MKTKILTLFAAMLLFCSSVATAQGFESGGIYYNINDPINKTVNVDYKGPTYDSYENEYTGSVTIPSFVAYEGNYYKVINIGNKAFQGCTALASVTISEGVDIIGAHAFYGCTGLKV